MHSGRETRLAASASSLGSSSSSCSCSFFFLTYHPTIQRRCNVIINWFARVLEWFLFLNTKVFHGSKVPQSFPFDAFSIMVGRCVGPESFKNTSSTSPSSRCDAEFYKSRSQRTFDDHAMFDSARNYDLVLRHQVVHETLHFSEVFLGWL